MRRSNWNAQVTGEGRRNGGANARLGRCWVGKVMAGSKHGRIEEEEKTIQKRAQDGIQMVVEDVGRTGAYQVDDDDEEEEEEKKQGLACEQASFMPLSKAFSRSDFCLEKAAAHVTRRYNCRVIFSTFLTPPSHHHESKH